MTSYPFAAIDWALEPRGARTGAVLATLEAAPRKRTQFRDIKRVTGLDTRTLIAILYSLQTQGKVAPVTKAETKDEIVYAKVDNETVFPEPIQRVCPFKPRRRRNPDISPGKELKATARSAASGASSAVLGSADEVAGPNWLVPRLPPRGLNQLGVARVTHCLVTAADLADDDLAY